MEKRAGAPIRAPPSSCPLVPLSFRAWLAAKFPLTTAVLLALRPAGLDLRFPVPVLRLAELALQPAGLDLRFPVLDLHPAGLDLRLAGLSLTSTLLLGREAPDEPHHIVGLSITPTSYR